jgi:hypothetical protein
MSALRRTSAYLILPIGLAIIPAFSGAAPAPPGEKGVLEWFKVEKGGDWLLLPVTFGGKKYQFLLDTGCACNSFDRALLSGESTGRVKLTGPYGSVECDTFKAPYAAVSHLAVPMEDPVVVFDFAKLRETTGHEVYGILGMTFLRQHVLRIDFDAGEVVFLESVADRAGQRFPLSHDKWGCPHLHANISGYGETTFLVDTGDADRCTGHLDKDLFDTLLDNTGVKYLESSAAGSISGTSIRRLGRGKGFDLGDCMVQDPIVGEWYGPNKWNDLGLGYLSRFVVTFDFPNDAIYLKKGKRFKHRDTLLADRSGLTIQRRDGNAVVTWVEKGKAAAVAGFKLGDIIMKIDDLGADGLSFFKFDQMFSIADKKYRITVRRCEEDLELTLNL